MAFEPVTGFIPGGNAVIDSSGNALDTNVFDVTQIDTTQLFAIGTEVECFDTTNKTRARFVYHQGVASVVATDACILKHGLNACILLDDAVSGAEIGGLIGFAMAAIVASRFGWFQVWGRAEANVLGSFAADGLIYTTTTAGTVDDSAGGGQVLNARSESAIDTPNTGSAYIDIWYPSIAGQSTGLA